ncbi:Methyltransferase domain-containing protein [Amycolatopsis marina]|uniref:Methyltransferase domain-containing protein n=1 Tax=Amycolatopsis marina TaxID=490629 RepID=A0A1I0XWC4_9PSEU|nr:class I SAM-dependent methyltransferase [Amycolatopsis marina]SFB04610.1 Methyltransferase domain-containing protein [Amycolatopsis marina]
MDFDSATEKQMQVNQANWDARTPIHVASRFYGLDGRRSPESWFGPFEWDDLGELRDRDLIHLQCHLGTETIAFARRGARTTGLDFSGESITQARRIAQREGVDIDYVHANVYDSVNALGEHRFDIVYTGKGALCYLPDLSRWASVIADLLRTGGLIYVVEFHPVLQSLAPKPAPGEGPELLLRHDYLGGRGAIEHTATSTYTDGPALDTATCAYEWMHGLGEVITALVEAGLRIEHLRETDLLPWPRWDRMVRDECGWWRLPPNEPRIPLLYSLRARKP